MKFEAAVFLMVFEFISANCYKFSIAFKRFSHAVVLLWSTKVLKFSIKFLSTGLETDVVLFLNEFDTFANPAELFSWLPFTLLATVVFCMFTFKSWLPILLLLA